ncbi:hypothetical protein ACOMHN_014050 [Nucella lapillus]
MQAETVPKLQNNQFDQTPQQSEAACIAEQIESEIRRDFAEEQAGFRPKRSTVKQIFSIRILIEKHLQHQHDLFYNFIDFKKAFDRVWHDGLWQVMRNYNIDSNIIDVIKALYDDSKSAVLQNNQIGECFQNNAVNLNRRLGLTTSPCDTGYTVVNLNRRLGLTTSPCDTGSTAVNLNRRFGLKTSPCDAQYIRVWE